jgi:hypothetical protein
MNPEHLLFLTPLLPVGIIFLVSRTSGWRTLALRYPLRGAVPRAQVWMGYGVFRGWIGYNGGIIIASDSAGLYLRGMPVLLSWCHAPIFIPWPEVTEIHREGGLLTSAFRIETRAAPEVHFALRPWTFDAIRDKARAAGVPGEY